MGQKEYIKLFEQKKVRSVWDDEKEEWFFSVVDVVEVLTDSIDPKQYIKKMRTRDPELNASWGTICTLTRMKASDGKKRLTDMKSKPVVWKFNLQNPSQWFGNLTCQLKNSTCFFLMQKK